MKRKVIQIADSTMLVSLPKRWADEQNIKKGDEIFVEADGPVLTIRGDSKPPVDRAEIHLNEYGIMAARAIYALYKKGIDEVTITVAQPSDMKIIQDCLADNSAIGYEIIEQGSNRCVIKNVAGQPEEFEMILRRVFLMLSTMSSEGLTALKNRDKISLKNAQALEKGNNRLTTLCRRYINKNGKSRYTKIGPLYYIIEELERCADEYKYMFDYINSFDAERMPISKEFLELYKEVDAMFRDFTVLFYKFDAQKAAAIAERRKNIVARCLKNMQKNKNGKETVTFHHLLVITQKIFNLVGPYIVIA